MAVTGLDVLGAVRGPDAWLSAFRAGRPALGVFAGRRFGPVEMLQWLADETAVVSAVVTTWVIRMPAGRAFEALAAGGLAGALSLRVPRRQTVERLRGLMPVERAETHAKCAEIETATDGVWSWLWSQNIVREDTLDLAILTPGRPTLVHDAVDRAAPAGEALTCFCSPSKAAEIGLRRVALKEDWSSAIGGRRAPHPPPAGVEARWIPSHAKIIGSTATSANVAAAVREEWVFSSPEIADVRRGLLDAVWRVQPPYPRRSTGRDVERVLADWERRG